MTQPDFYGAQTWIDVLQKGVQDYLVNTIPGLSRDRIFPSVWDDDLHTEFPPADFFLTLFVPDSPVDQTDVTGGGAINTAFDSTLLVTLFLRLEADLENRSPQFLAEQVGGVYARTKTVISALQMWPGPTITGPDGSAISQLRRPLRLRPGWRVTRRANRAGQRWGVVPISFEMSWVADLGSPYPNWS
jgi:hypothetical protein